MDWDERRRLARDITSLSSADLQGVLLLCRLASPNTVIYNQEISSKSRDWNMIKDNDWDGSCFVKLDALDESALQQLREYVNACYIPNPAPQEQCEICCGLWSCGRVVACGNSICTTRIHEECFGVVLRNDPRGPWICPSCAYGSPLQCCLCLRDGGAVKPTSDGRWAHVICALGAPELSFRDVPTMEPIDGFAEIDNTRLRSMCNLCKRKGGAVVVCEDDNCGTAFHISCAADAGLWIGAQANPLTTPPTPAKPFALFCEKHLPSDRIIGAKRFVAEEDLVLEKMHLPPVICDEHLHRSRDDYTFVLDSASYLIERHVWKERITTTVQKANSFEITPRLYTHGRFPVKTLLSEMVHKVADTHGEFIVPTSTFPPAIPRGSSVPCFPDGPSLVGAIIEVYWTGFDEWVRARVTDWDPSRGMNQVQYLDESRMEWLTLRAGTCHIFHLSSDPPTRIKLAHYTYRNEGQWRPKPKEFAAST